MNKRIQEVRKRAGLNQDEFAAKLNLTKNYISLVETGKRDPSERTISDICRSFGVRRDWLMTGIGSMDEPLTRQQDIANVTITMRNEDPKSSRYLLLKMISEMPEEDIEDMLRFIEMVHDAVVVEKNKPQD